MSEAIQHILVVDDDDRLRHLIERYLKEEGFAVSTAQDATAMDKRLAREHIDLIILDVMLPGEDGIAICKRLQQQPDSPPILMLSAKGEDLDRITGLETGADDYLPKPFNTRELLARIKAILRRNPKEVPGSPGKENEIISFGDFAINLGERTLHKKDEGIPLSTGEFAVMKALITHPRKTLSREQLMSIARGREYNAYDRTIDTQISRLRKIFEIDPARPRYIQTVWGAGYVFIPEGEKSHG
jgi:two-component system, OmpR family, phosphate regulon response regulator OmpR